MQWDNIACPGFFLFDASWHMIAVSQFVGKPFGVWIKNVKQLENVTCPIPFYILIKKYVEIVSINCCICLDTWKFEWYAI